VALISPAEAYAIPRLLRSWAAISKYTGLSVNTLRRYAKREGLPVHRWGRHVVLVPEMLGHWLAVRERHQRARRDAGLK
jgi:hypothetical protein